MNSWLYRGLLAAFIILTAVLLMVGCATTHQSGMTQGQSLLTVRTCIKEVAHIDPGPLTEAPADERLDAAILEYYKEFGARDIMGMGRDMTDRKVRRDANRALLFACWRDGFLPPSHPLATRPFEPFPF